MTLANFTELAGAIGDWLDRDDLSAKAPIFIKLAEARMNRLLDDPEMEVAVDLPVADNRATLPADYGSMVSITTGTGLLQAMGAVEFAGLRNMPGDARYYAIIDNELRFAPTGAVSTTLIYRRRIPALTTEAPTNWLLALAPDAYLFGALTQAEAYLAEDDRVGAWKAAFEEAIGELRIDATRRKWGSGPLAPRIRRT